MSALEIISISISIIYFLFFLIISNGFIQSIRKKESEKNDLKPVTLIIPVKDEAQNLSVLFNSLLQLRKCEGEIIFVNDHSSDHSLQLIQNFKHPYFQIRFFSLGENEFGKKAAIEKGILEAKNSLIVTTDADCVFPPDWLFMHSFSNQNGILAGSVDLIPSKNFAGFIFESENLAIQLIGSAMSYYGRPIVISGANLSYPVSVFKKIDPYQSNRNTLSGDDIFLMQNARKNNISILINQEKGIRVYTKHVTLWDFFIQRIRWMKKKSSLSDFSTIAVGLILFLSSFLFLFFAGYQFVSNQMIPFLIISMTIKTVVDFLLLFLIVHQRRRKIILLGFIPAFVLNLLSTSILPLVGWWIPVKWKGRKI